MNQICKSCCGPLGDSPWSTRLRSGEILEGEFCSSGCAELFKRDAEAFAGEKSGGLSEVVESTRRFDAVAAIQDAQQAHQARMQRDAAAFEGVNQRLNETMWATVEDAAEYQKQIASEWLPRVVSSAAEQFRARPLNPEDLVWFYDSPLLARHVELTKPDPYATHREREAAMNYAGLTYDHPTNVRARKVAALRESMSAKAEPRFPSEARSDRVYEANRSAK